MPIPHPFSPDSRDSRVQVISASPTTPPPVQADRISRSFYYDMERSLRYAKAHPKVPTQVVIDRFVDDKDIAVEMEIYPEGAAQWVDVHHVYLPKEAELPEVIWPLDLRRRGWERYQEIRVIPVYHECVLVANAFSILHTCRRNYLQAGHSPLGAANREQTAIATN